MPDPICSQVTLATHHFDTLWWMEPHVNFSARGRRRILSVVLFA